MNIKLGIGLLLAFTASTVGCKPKETAESECESYVAARKKEGWPAGDAVKKECVKELAAIENGGDAEKWKNVGGCFGEGITLAQSHDCYEIWVKADGPFIGLGADASGDWAQGSPKKLDSEACSEGAFVIAQRKMSFGLLKTKGEAKTHREQLEKACNEQKGDAAYAAQFACMRRAEKQVDLAGCVTGGVASNPYGDLGVIEACVSKCSAQHGREATPAYLDCFNACKASGGK